MSGKTFHVDEIKETDVENMCAICIQSWFYQLQIVLCEPFDFDLWFFEAMWF